MSISVNPFGYARKYSLSFTVASAASESAAVDARGKVITGIRAPSDLRGLSSITSIMESEDGSTDWTTVCDENGDALAAIPLTASYHIGLGPYARYLYGAAYVKLVFNTTASAALTFTGRAIS